MTPAGGPIWAVVPVKPFDIAKQRLSPLLSAAERSALARTMLEDVLAALTAFAGLAGLLVVTRDPQAAEMARRAGGVALAEDATGGLNGAIATAGSHLRAAGMLVVPSDIPHISAAALGEAVEALAAPRALALARAARDGGTNLLACRPANVIAPSFGPDSFARHRALAWRAQIVPGVVTRSDIGCDLDRPEDVTAFLALHSATRTHAMLCGVSVAA
jgi:2-phospho-L-lactate guanylyltransferase